MAAISESLRAELLEPEFSEGYAESFLDTYIATQLKVLREQNEWTQAKLAEKMGKKQTVISRSENVNYSSWNINTLKEYARVFRLRLHVSFETYGSLIDEMNSFSRQSLQRAPRESDPGLLAEAEEPCDDNMLAVMAHADTDQVVGVGAQVTAPERIQKRPIALADSHMRADQTVQQELILSAFGGV